MIHFRSNRKPEVDDHVLPLLFRYTSILKRDNGRWIANKERRSARPMMSMADLEAMAELNVMEQVRKH